MDRKTGLRFGIVGSVLVVASILIWLIYEKTNTSTLPEVTISKAPSDASVVVDGKSVSGDTVHLSVGKHTYVISRQDFRSVTGEVDVRAGTDGLVITGLLEPINSAGQEVYNEQRAIYTAAEGKAGAAAEERGQQKIDNNPILSLLPYTNLLFSIGYRADSSDPTGQAIIIEIGASPLYRDAAVTQIKDWGYNPANYKINFDNEENPF